MNKKIILIVSLILLAIFIVLIVILSRQSIEKKLINYIEKRDYVQDIGTLYIKNNTNNSINNCTNNSNNDCYGQAYYFNVNSYELIENKNTLLNDTYFELIATYDYKNDSLTYTHRITYENGVLIFNGKYDNNDYSCNLEYSYGIDVTEEDLFCKDVENDIKDFYYEAKLLISDTNLLEQMKK